MVGHSFRDWLDFRKNACYPAGHYYSPIISKEEVRAAEKQIWKEPLPGEVAGIRLNTEEQLLLLQKLSAYYPELPFTDVKEKTRYFFSNDYYSYTDGIILYSMIRHIRPKRIIEAGSGFSSSLMLDVNQLFFQNKISLTFIEPNPERLYSLMSEEDRSTSRVIRSPIQQVDLSIFRTLEKGDILFIDSTHVSKTGSDVNHILFTILPSLSPGVFIHFHDIFYPFEYPKKLVYEGRNWNEDYLLRSFLMYNNQFEIRLFAHYLHEMHPGSFEKMPLCYRNKGGDLWLEKK